MHVGHLTPCHILVLTGSLLAAIAARGCGAAVECGESNSKPPGAKGPIDLLGVDCKGIYNIWN